MSATPKILAFAGSLRRDSFNKKLVLIAADGAEKTGADVTVIDLKDYPLPVYDGDEEDAHGLPKNAATLKDLFVAHDGLLIASPEYNSSYSGALKNVIDWVSRPVEGRPPLYCFSGKIAGIMAASPGGLGGLRMLPQLRTLLQNIQVTVLPNMIGIPAAHEAFDDKGSLKNEKKHAAVQSIGADVANMLAKLRA